jgi:predicted methyltransferase
MTRIPIFLVVCSIAACAQDSSPDSSSTTGSQPSGESIYAVAVADPGRSDADRARDVNRKPAEVLAFLDIRPGMDVLDMYSGGGYYTEIVSRVVGTDGSVHAHNNSAYTNFVGEETDRRYAGNRLANVDLLMAENNELDLAPDSYDAILMILAYHDIYYVAPNDGWPKIDGPKFVAELFEGLRPGGILGVVDHYAAAGSPRETGNTLHRIDPDIVISEIEAAGFVLDGKSDVLRNMDDDHSLSMAAPEIRGRTDRFVLRFIKPE